jgi:hypothetical protein
MEPSPDEFIFELAVPDFFKEMYPAFAGFVKRPGEAEDFCVVVSPETLAQIKERPAYVLLTNLLLSYGQVYSFFPWFRCA